MKAYSHKKIGECQSNKVAVLYNLKHASTKSSKNIIKMNIKNQIKEFKLWKHMNRNNNTNFK